MVTAIADYSDAHEHIYPITVDNTTVYPDGIVVPDNGEGLVTLHHHTASGQHDWLRPATVDACITGIPYQEDSTKTTYGDLVTAASQIILAGTNSMSIDFTPDPNGGNPFVVVMLNGYVTYTGNIPITGGGADGREETGDDRIHLQSHWGSGVKFIYEEVTAKPSPE